MNEILQKRIEEAVKRTIQEYVESFRYENGMELEPLIKIFLEKIGTIFFEHGISFALQNQWIPVEEALPPIREKDRENRSWSDWVLIMTHEGGAFMDCYAFHRKEWLNNGNDVTHWMEIPKLNSNEE